VVVQGFLSEVRNADPELAGRLEAPLIHMIESLS
jgi:hypothetical protein